MRIALLWWTISLPTRRRVSHWAVAFVKSVLLGGAAAKAAATGPSMCAAACMYQSSSSPFAKNEKDNLAKAEQAELIAMSKALLARYGDRK